MCKNGRIWRWVDHKVGHSTLSLLFGEFCYLDNAKVWKLFKAFMSNRTNRASFIAPILCSQVSSFFIRSISSFFFGVYYNHGTEESMYSLGELTFAVAGPRVPLSVGLTCHLVHSVRNPMVAGIADKRAHGEFPVAVGAVRVRHIHWDF